MGRIDSLIRAIEEAKKEYEGLVGRAEKAIFADRKRVEIATEATTGIERHRVGLARYLFSAKPLFVLSAPVIFTVFAPIFLLDLWITVYQKICFPIYGIPVVRRGEYVTFDRGDLPYLNFLEKVFCAYCSYANGVAGYFREVAARTEQYWCPIKHARKILSEHDRYPKFFEHGDAESYRKGLERLRRELGDEKD